MNREHIAAYLEAILDRSIDIFMEDGSINPTRFVLGDEKVLFAQPVDAIGQMLTDDARLGLQSMMAIAMQATLIGRIDEVYVPDNYTIDTLSDDQEELQQRSHVDPSIHTVLCVEAVDLETSAQYIATARFVLNDEGQAEWERDAFEDVTDDDEPHRNAMLDDFYKKDITIDNVLQMTQMLHWEMSLANIMLTDGDEV